MESQHAAHSFKWLLNESLRVCVVGRQNMNLQETEPLTKTGSSVSVWVLLPGPGGGGAVLRASPSLPQPWAPLKLFSPVSSPLVDFCPIFPHQLSSDGHGFFKKYFWRHLKSEFVSKQGEKISHRIHEIKLCNLEKNKLKVHLRQEVLVMHLGT